MTGEALLHQTLRTEGQSLTAPRQKVFEALQGQEPMSMRELVEHCPGVDRASVYRCVSLFERLGIVERLQTGWKYKLELSDSFHDHHHHATCILCSESFVIREDKAIEEYLLKIAHKLKFKLERHQLELQGYCAACQALLKD